MTANLLRSIPAYFCHYDRFHTLFNISANLSTRIHDSGDNMLSIKLIQNGDSTSLIL